MSVKKRLKDEHSKFFLFVKIFAAEEERLIVGGGALLFLFDLVYNHVFPHEVEETSCVGLGITSRNL